MIEFLRTVPRNSIFVLTVILGITLAFPLDTAKSEKESKDIGNSQEQQLQGKAETPSNPIQQWLSGSSGGGSMILGTYQALLMPMPKGQDVVNGIGNVIQGIQGLFPR